MSKLVARLVISVVLLQLTSLQVSSLQTTLSLLAGRSQHQANKAAAEMTSGSFKSSSRCTFVTSSPTTSSLSSSPSSWSPAVRNAAAFDATTTSAMTTSTSIAPSRNGHDKTCCYGSLGDAESPSWSEEGGQQLINDYDSSSDKLKEHMPQEQALSLNSQILSIAFPALISLAIDPLMNVVDTFFVGRFSPEGLTSLGLNAYVFTFCFYIFNFMATVPVPLVASALARNDKEAASRLIGSLLTLALVAGSTLLIFLQVFGDSVLMVMGATAESLPDAMHFLSIRALAAPAVLVISVSNGAFRGFLDTKTPLYIALTVNVVNVLLDPLLIIKFNMGAIGAATSTVLAEWIAAITFLVLLSQKKPMVVPVVASLPWDEVKSILSASGAVFGRTVCLQSFLSIASGFAARTGVYSIAAHQVASQVWLLLSFSYDSLAVAAQGLVATQLATPRPPPPPKNGEGKDKGGNDEWSQFDDTVDKSGVTVASSAECVVPLRHITEARRVADRVLMIAVGAGVVLFVVFHVLGDGLPRLFTTDQNIITQVSPLIVLVGLMQPINAFVFSGDGILQGSQDFAYEAKAMLLSTVLAGLWIVWQGQSLQGVWFGLLLLQVSRGLTFSFRYWLDSSSPMALTAPTSTSILISTSISTSTSTSPAPAESIAVADERNQSSKTPRRQMLTSCDDVVRGGNGDDDKLSKSNGYYGDDG